MLIVGYGNAFGQLKHLRVEIFGDTLFLTADESMLLPFDGTLNYKELQHFHRAITNTHYQPLINGLLQYRKVHNLNDWLYYQLVRHTAQQLAPKAENYYRYTLYKWFLMVKSGYDATLNIYNDQLLFYIYSDDEVLGIPLYTMGGKQYVCLNIHDYIRGYNEFSETVYQVKIKEPQATQAFSYKVTQLPEFCPTAYSEKAVFFPFRKKEYEFSVKINEQVGNLFTNYPVVQYADYFNIPLSKHTYQSLLPSLKQNMEGMKVRVGVDYLMNFTRYAFLYEDDRTSFGQEKRLSPEQTLLSTSSDCDDRAALFFYLVKEIYNLPMIALEYADHITIAVQLQKPVGNTITFEGKEYTLCEPTPQRKHLPIGKVDERLRNAAYEVVYAYRPD